MKTSIYTLVLLSLTLFGCRKESTAPDPGAGEKQVVSIKIADFSHQGYTTFADSLTNIDVRVYQGGTPISAFRVQRSDTSVVKLTLSPGTYYVAFLAGTGYEMTSSSSLSSDWFRPNSINYEIFFKGIEITVNGADITEEVRLNRINSQLDFQLSDTNIPANISEIHVGYYTHHETYFTGKPRGFLGYNTRKLPIMSNASGRYIAPYTYSLLYLTDNPTAALYLTYHNSAGEQVGRRDIPLEFHRNRKTIVKGSLFGSNNTMSTSAISLDRPLKAN